MIARSRTSAYLAVLQQNLIAFTNSTDLKHLHDLIGDARIVMLGEATHGTSEFYEWRRVISEKLIRDHGFSFIAVEGDWPDCQRVHRHVVDGIGSPRDALEGYRRFPTWMWGNEEVLELVEWLRSYNERNARPVGFHGLDVYSMFDSARLVIEYLERVDPTAAPLARRAYECFERFGPAEDPHHYAYGVRFVPSSCENEVAASLSHIDRLRDLYSRINPDHVDPGEAYFDARMNALVTQNAEAYYRIMVGGDVESWNVRDRHMIQVLSLLLDHYGRDSRAIVWAHNTHIGDYRATDMQRHGYINLGGLAREQFGYDNVRLIGFGTHRGTVMAAREWGDEPQVMTVPEAIGESLEDLLHQTNVPQLFLPLRNLPQSVRETLNDRIGHRAIGVVYEPRFESRSQYVPTQLASRYDGFIFIDHTHAVHPLGIPADLHEEPETWPSGM
jgi:erythromycin esterase